MKKKNLLSVLMILALVGSFTPAVCVAASVEPISQAPVDEYTVGPDDILVFSVLRPELIQTLVTVAGDGSISVPYIGNVRAKGKTLDTLQQEIAQKLGDGYMKYPVVTLALQESRSRKFFIYGEVTKPGSFPMEENMTVFRAIALAGGLTKFGDSSKAKILRPRTDRAGYETFKVNLKAIINGSDDADVPLKSGDVVVVSEGIF